jgi:hypothetical protein
VDEAGRLPLARYRWQPAAPWALVVEQ